MCGSLFSEPKICMGMYQSVQNLADLISLGIVQHNCEATKRMLETPVVKVGYEVEFEVNTSNWVIVAHS